MIGASRMWADRMYAPRYFPKVGAAAVLVSRYAPSMSRQRLSAPTAKHFPQQAQGQHPTAVRVSGTFRTVDGLTITVVDGIVTRIT